MKNYYEIRGDVTDIHLSRYGLIATIDTIDLDKVLGLGNINWNVNIMRGVRWTYAMGSINKKTFILHRFLTNAPKGMVVDHINHNTMDNRQCNLQVITNAENIWKRSKVTYAWQDELTEKLKKQEEVILLREKDIVYQEEFQRKKDKKIKKRMKKENKTKRYISIQKGIEWDPKKKRFEPVYEYKAV